MKIYVEPITRDDLEKLGLASSQIEKLSEDDLIAITNKIHTHLNEDVFWDELDWQVQALLETDE